MERLTIRHSLLLFLASTLLGNTEGRNVACHVPLDAWNPALSMGHPPFDIETIDFTPCSEIILSTETPLFSEDMLSSMDVSIFQTDLSTLERLVARSKKFPGISLTLSLRSKYNLLDVRGLFPNASSIDSLLMFMGLRDISSFDLAWNMVEKHAQFIPFIHRRLNLNRRKFSVTISKEPAKTVLQSVSTYIDLFRLIPDCNQYYSYCQDLLPNTYVEVPASNSIELGIGSFLRTYISLNLSVEKLVIGVPLDAVVWQTGGEFISDVSSLKGRKAKKSLMPFRESCDFLRMGWKEIAKKENYFSQTLIAPCHSVWSVQLNVTLLARKISLLLHYGLNSFAVYDFISDDNEGDCTSTFGSSAPLTNSVFQLVFNKSVPETFNLATNQSTGLLTACIPFYGFTDNCAGYFGL